MDTLTDTPAFLDPVPEESPAAEALEGDDAALPVPGESTPARSNPAAVVLTLRVDAHLRGMRADQFLCHRIRRLSRTRAQKIILQGDLARRAGAPLRASSRLRAEEELLLWVLPKDQEPPDTPLSILFMDEDVVVFDKAPLLTVHPTARYYRSTLTQLLFRRGFPPSAAPDAVPFPRPAHRLDRETSGVLVCARSRSAERAWKNGFLRGGVKKTYLALCSGRPTFQELDVDQPLGFLTGLPVRIKVGAVASGWPARTLFRVLWTGADRCLVQCEPLTGRTHQIRAHLSQQGLPILGDKLYGPQGDAWFAAYADGGMTPELASVLAHPRQALHAAVLRGAGGTFVAPWPEDLAQLVPEAAPRAHSVIAQESASALQRPSTWWARGPVTDPAGTPGA